ncbi:uncharacterized protein LOC131220733 [Magnolia sinica]|uniref:uncharacterized protein LOC131220733 n=1 Tax=Magnolia sinica TaxID=86752 RepID=UPI00265B5B4E|nr:uncharacterized protein LOC131220733 [Magnolia sinica]
MAGTGFQSSAIHLWSSDLSRPFPLTDTISKRSSLKRLKTPSLRSLSSSSRPLTPQCSSERGDASSSLNGVGGANSEVPHENPLQVVLVSPQIPGTAGCVARTCAASAVRLHLIEPLGFQVDDAKLKRAGIGLHYWPNVVVKVHDSWAAFKEYFGRQGGEKRLLAFTKRGMTVHSDFSYKQGDWLIFGSETFGLSPEVLLDCSNKKFGGGTIRIPMAETYVECLNLAVSVGIAVYEASRQLNYEQLLCKYGTSINSQNSFVSEDILA